MPANVDIATQEIVHMAEEADPEGGRTLGVLTKPDLVDKGAEDKVLIYLLLISINTDSKGTGLSNYQQWPLWSWLYHTL